jgi:hypothetical protein
MRDKRDKIAIMTSFGTPEDQGQTTQATYKESLTRKIESLIHDTYPWLGDFVLTLAEVDPDNDFAFGAARLSNYSGGFSVEFPIFYIEGQLMVIPTFVLPERDVSFPFNETFYKVIMSTLNSDDSIALVKEKADMSDTLKGVMSDNSAGPTGGLLKMSSFSMILSNLPRGIVKQYAKTASAMFPELTRDIQAAVKLSRFKGNLYHAVLNGKTVDKQAALKTDPSPMLSIVTPVFRSEAEYTERDENVDYVEQITNKAFVLPEANNKVNLTPIPDAQDLVKSLNEDFELMAPGELFEVVKSRCEKRKWEPQAIICLSNNEDYWLVPRAEPKLDPSYGGKVKGYEGLAYSSDRDKDILKKRHMSVNDMGGVFLFDYNYRYGSEFKDLVGKKVKDRVIYLPESREKYGYFEDILDTPLNIKHNLVANLQNGHIQTLPIRTEGNKIVLIPLELNYNMKDNDEYSVVYTTTTKGDNFIQNYNLKRQKHQAGDTPTDLEKLPVIKIVSDKITGDIETIHFHKEVLGYETRGMYAPEGSSKSYVTFGFNGSKTYNPSRFEPYGSDNSTTTLKPVAKESPDRKIIFTTMKTSAEEMSSSLICKIYDDDRLNPDFLLNNLGIQPDTDTIDLGIPYMEIDIKADRTVDAVLPNIFGTEGATALRINYDDADSMLRALGGAGVDPDDLKEIKQASHVGEMSGVPYNTVVTKLAYAISPTPQAAEQGLDTESILPQLMAILQGLQSEQEFIKKEVGNRSKLIDTQFKLLDKKLTSIDELKQQIGELTGAVSEVVQGISETQAVPTPEAEQGVPPEVIEEMAKTVIDPQNSPMQLAPEEIEVLTAAANGDVDAAQQIGLDEQNHSMLMQFYGELQNSAPAPTQNAAPQQPGPEDLATLAKIASDPEGAVSQGGMEQGMVDQLMAALNGDANAAQQMGLTQDMVNQVMQQVSQQNGPTPEDIQQLVQIVSDPEGAVTQGGMDKGQVDMLVAAVNGDPAAMEQAGLDEATVQQVQQAMSQGPQAAPGEEGVPEEPPPTTEEQLMQSYEQAKKMVEAYLNPARAEELQVSPEDIGTVAIILRAPDSAAKNGVPGNIIQSVSDSYMALTGKPLYASAEKEFSTVAGAQDGPEIGYSKNVISNSKEFEQYTKPLAETSALLDLIPKVKTAKLFFQNADEFKNMLKIMGEMMMNLQVNAVKYRDMMGVKAYERLLARINKVYEDFGTMILQMYNLDTNSGK